MRVKAVAVLVGAIGLTTGLATTGALAGHHQRFANCTDAVARLGSDRSHIRLEVECWAPRGGERVGFAVARLGPHGGWRLPGFRNFDRHPAVIGPGRHGHCGWSRGTLDCMVSAEGSITVVETMRVRPGARCSRPLYVTITVTTCAPTVHRPCPALLTVAELFKDRPRGC